MASILWDSQVFYTPPVAADPGLTRRNVEPRASCCPQEDVVVISSGGESGDDDGQSDTSSSFDELCGRLAECENAESSSVAVIGMYLRPSSSDESR